jgi:poly(beta-D-mannuronate) C5 epimerase
MSLAVSQSTSTILASSASDSNGNDNDEGKDNEDNNKSINQNCIGYNASDRTITVRCTSRVISLTDVHNTLRNRNILDKQPDGVWRLNAGIVIDKGASMVVDSKDTKWLKIVANGTIAYPITVLGSLTIDSVKITSWNPQTNGYAISKGNRELNDVLGKYDVTEGFPRPYIRIEEEATGNTNITNSEIAYLGYEAGLGEGKTGLTYLGGDNSVLKNNDIHDLYFAFYSKDVGGMVIENNHIHNNGHYGLDPHTRTHDMLIRNNTVHDNGSIGIICSLDCSHIIVENNKAYSNARIGIMLSRNTAVVTDEDKSDNSDDTNNGNQSDGNKDNTSNYTKGYKKL